MFMNSLPFYLSHEILLSTLPCKVGTWGIERFVLHSEAQFPQATTSKVSVHRFAEWHFNSILELLLG